MNSKIIDLEDQISKLVFKDNGRTVHFEYTSVDVETPINSIPGMPDLYTKVKKYKVSAHTYNSQTQETFLLRSESGRSYEYCLERILVYVQCHRKTYNSYTVNWAKKGTNDKNISYFNGSSIIEIMDKFFEGKDPSEYNVYEIKMNPTS